MERESMGTVDGMQKRQRSRSKCGAKSGWFPLRLWPRWGEGSE